MDWNWFFSALAQSSAAIVGVFAAFVITKIINNQADFSRSTAKTKDILNQCERFKDEVATIHFQWWSKHSLDSELDRLERTLKEVKEAKTPEQYYEEFNFPEFIERAVVLQQIEGRIRVSKSRGQRHNSFRSGIDTLTTRSIINNGLQPELDHEEKLINRLVVELRHHTRTVLLHYNYITGDPESSSAISYSIVGAVALFFVGVIYPLSFTPLATGHAPQVALAEFFDILFSLRGLLLSAISLIFVGMLGAFMIINFRLRHQQEDKDTLQYYSSIGNYSDYLAIMEANRKIQDLLVTIEDEGI